MTAPLVAGKPAYKICHYGADVHTGIWWDDEWRTLSSTAHWLWLYRVSHGGARLPFDPYELAEYGRIDVFDIILAATELSLTKFGEILEYRPRRRRTPFTKPLRRQVYERDGYRCRHCGTAENLSVDHVYPFSLGGQDGIENLQTLCRSCNSRKGARV